MDPVVANAREIIELGSKSFATAAKLFNPATREQAFMLYAWCRYCDDQIDGQVLGFGQHSPEPAEQRAILTRLSEHTAVALDGGAPEDEDPVFAALRRVVSDSDMPRRYPLELLEGFAMDVDRRRYQSLEDTLLYCYHVAGVVGAMMATIMGVRDPQILDRAIDLGIAFQLTNISRDVMEDAADNRVYLPEQWLIEAGAPTSPAEFPGNEERVFAVVERLLAEANRYYTSARHGISALPFRSAWAIAAARSVYGGIGQVVLRRGAGAWKVRAGVSNRRKVVMLLSSLLTATWAVGFEKHRGTPAREDLWTYR